MNIIFGLAFMAVAFSGISWVQHVDNVALFIKKKAVVRNHGIILFIVTCGPRPAHQRRWRPLQEWTRTIRGEETMGSVVFMPPSQARRRAHWHRDQQAHYPYGKYLYVADRSYCGWPYFGAGG